MNIENLIRRNIINLKPYTSARSQNLDGILLDANENAIGSTFETDLAKDLNRYPDPYQLKLRKSIGEMIGVNYKNILCGVGSDELIDLLIRIFCSPSKDKAIILEPTYGMYKVACDINEIETIAVPLNDNFQIDFQSLNENFSSEIKLIFICSPNNPTGNLINAEDIEKIVRSYNAMIIVDEAYIDFCEEGSAANLIKKYENIAILRTFSKAWGLAGARLGYCISSEKVISFLLKVKAPYNINKLTEQVVLEAIKNCRKKDEIKNIIISERDRVYKELKNFDKIYAIYPSDANFILFKINNSKLILKRLLEKGIVARDRSSQLNLENSIRVTIGTKEQNDLFLTELKKAADELCK